MSAGLNGDMRGATAAAPGQRKVLGVDFHVWDGIYQGSRSHLLGLYRAAIRQAPDIDFVFFLDGVQSLREAHPEFAAPNVRLAHMPHRPALWRLGVQLPWLQRRHRVDVLHLQYRLPFVRLGATACTIHDVLFETHPQYFSRFFTWQSHITFRHAARRADVLCTVSQFSRDELVRLYGVAPQHIAVTCNGVDFARFYPGTDGLAQVQALGLVPGAYLLTVGRLEPRKNHAALVRAYALLPADAPPLVIVGQRDFSYGALFDEIARLGLASRVRHIDNVADAALPALLRHAAVFVYPAFAEGFGMPVAEAMASGVPVITSNTTALPEVAGPGALLVSPGVDAELAQAMARVLVDAGLRQRLVVAGLQHVRQFDWAVSAAVLLAAVRRQFAKDAR